MGSVAKSYMRKGFLIYEEMRKYLVIYKETISHIYDFATAPFWISLYLRKLLFSFFITICTVSCVDNITGLADVL
jgi:hypothetical protein